MKDVIYEYASTILAVIAALGFMLVMGHLFLGADGFFALLINTGIGGD